MSNLSLSPGRAAMSTLEAIIDPVGTSATPPPRRASAPGSVLDPGTQWLWEPLSGAFRILGRRGIMAS